LTVDFVWVPLLLKISLNGLGSRNEVGLWS
jgi:hypothetical protein